MGKRFTTDRLLLIFAVIFFAAYPLLKKDNPNEFVSFNDGELECANIFVQPGMSREVQASLLRDGANKLLETGCVNFSFPKE
jgi:hypothetical protein